ncbi:hypothetical protein [Sphingomonas sp. RS2018]
MREEDVAYYAKRARQEREKASACHDNAIALAHLRMADGYDRMLRGEPRESFLLQQRGDPAAYPIQQRPADQHG